MIYVCKRTVFIFKNFGTKLGNKQNDYFYWSREYMNDSGEDACGGHL